MNSRWEHPGTSRFRPHSVTYTHIVTDYSAQVTYIKRCVGRAVIANQYQATIVIMTIIVLNDRSPAIPIRIKSLCIPRSFMTTYFIKLHQSIITTPRPNTCCRLCVRKHIRTVTHYIVFYQGTVTTDRYNTIPWYFLYQISPYHGMLAGMPVLPVAISSPNHSITGTSQNMAVLYG